MSATHRTGAAFLLSLLTACGPGWRRQPELPAAGFAQRQQVRVWHRGGLLQLHGVVVRGDSLSGIPFVRPLDCDSCRIGVARAQIDSVQVGNPERGFWLSVALGGAILLGWSLLYCFEGCSYD